MRTPRKDMFVKHHSNHLDCFQSYHIFDYRGLAHCGCNQHGILTLSVLNAEGQKGNALVK